VQWFEQEKKVEEEDQLEKGESQRQKEISATTRSRPGTRCGPRHTPLGHSSGAGKSMDVDDHLLWFVFGLMLMEVLAWLGGGVPAGIARLAPAG